MRTAYSVVGEYRSRDPENDGETEHWGTFDTLEQAQDFLRGMGYLWDLKGWQKGRWLAAISEETETEAQYRSRKESERWSAEQLEAALEWLEAAEGRR